MSMFSVSIENFGVEKHKIAMVLKSISEDKNLGKGILEASKMLERAIKAKAPKGKPGRKNRKGAPITPGGLRRSIVGKPFGGGATVNILRGALVAINFKIGPHAHLVEYGHRIVRRGKASMLRRAVSGGAAKGALEANGTVPPHPYFWPTVKAREAQVARIIETWAIRAVQRAGRR